MGAEQSFLGHSAAPFEVALFPNQVVSVSAGEAILWQFKGDFLERAAYRVASGASPGLSVKIRSTSDRTIRTFADQNSDRNSARIQEIL